MVFNISQIIHFFKNKRGKRFLFNEKIIPVASIGSSYIKPYGKRMY
ncbi:hypothetical protein KsCSTR_20240 [Candidatus Kuenenia stuttgartiensis]|uniref:Uncharacterized protein n=1 Tax=Kuenenia stuttgartiensis TaxID=174633 RepID=A0A6G7GQ03_KUEST|nr:hypothetical protein KsCSTR_20240 [Candidatus Kuenenia stuttgartiensis]